jgi:hypothetical protein
MTERFTIPYLTPPPSEAEQLYHALMSRFREWDVSTKDDEALEVTCI